MIPNVFCQCRRPLRRHKIPTSRRDLERTTDIFLTDIMENITLQVNEACLTEGDKFVGCTAKFRGAWEIVQLRPDLCPTE